MILGVYLSAKVSFLKEFCNRDRGKQKDHTTMQNYTEMTEVCTKKRDAKREE